MIVNPDGRERTEAEFRKLLSQASLRYARMDAWTYRMQHPDEQAVFNSAMTSNSRSEAQAVLEAYNFQPI